MDDLSNLKGVGPKLCEKLAQIKIHSIQDLLFHLPIRYQDRTRVCRIVDLVPGEQALLVAEIVSVQVIYRRRRMLIVKISDETASLQLRFFYFNSSQVEGFKNNNYLTCYGEARGSSGRLEIVHPEYRLLQDKHQGTFTEESLTPVYPVAQGLHQKTMLQLTDRALQWMQTQSSILPDVLHDYPGFNDDGYTLRSALQFVHRPPPEADVSAIMNGSHSCQKKLAFDELLAHHVSLIKLRSVAQKYKAPVFREPVELLNTLYAQLEFSLTGAQHKVLDEIRTDLASGRPMLRLIQGDVGSGKTIVAFISCLYATSHGYQAAIMAPTEILAEQHYRSISALAYTLGIRCALLVSNQKTSTRNEMLALISSATAQVIIGTHALFQESVEFKRLGLCVIDEQHRFGVSQRLSLTQKNNDEKIRPHQLVMTATPIPRTLAMSMYAHLDYSVIDELPPGRTPIKTVAIPDNRRTEVIDRIQQAVSTRRQAYWVCTLIEESDVLQCQAATDTFELLQKQLSEVQVGLIHGRMKSTEKEKVMRDFVGRKIDVLVATTVIEVGVDVPNASLIVIENAERLGLAQLHQLRGRVGRGSIESSCVLLYKAPLSAISRKRIEAMRQTTDGFELAKTDLELRGPGEVMGTRQTGDVRMRIADLARDMDLLPQVQKAAHWLWENYPDRTPLLIRRWLGQSAKYANV